MRRSTAEEEVSRVSDLYSSVTAEVKVKLVGMRDVCIHRRTSRNVSTAPNLSQDKFKCVVSLQTKIKTSEYQGGKELF